MNPNYNQTVTVYTCIKPADNGGTEAWHRRVIPNCFFSEATGDTFSGGRQSPSGAHICRLKADENYKPYDLWLSDQDTFWTVNKGDIIVLGECTDTITGEKGHRAADLLKKPHAFKVLSVTDNSRFRYGKHIKAVG